MCRLQRNCRRHQETSRLLAEQSRITPPAMNKEEKANREYRLYEFLRRASLDDSILLRTDDWKHVEQEIHALWPDFGRKLYEYGVNLSDTERRICWMARMNIPPLGMATILKRTKPAISLARSRLYEKLTHTPGTGKMFDEFIRKL